jgi:hypothetical protein
MTACCPIGGLGYRCQCADPSTPAEVPFCDCSKGQRVTVTLRMRFRTGATGDLNACPACYAEKSKRGQVLSQTTIAVESQ